MMSDYYDLRPEDLICECGWLACWRLGGDVLLRVEGSCCVGSLLSPTHDAVLTLLCVSLTALRMVFAPIQNILRTKITSWYVGEHSSVKRPHQAVYGSMPTLSTFGFSTSCSFCPFFKIIPAL